MSFALTPKQGWRTEMRRTKNSIRRKSIKRVVRVPRSRVFDKISALRAMELETAHILWGPDIRTITISLYLATWNL